MLFRSQPNFFPPHQFLTSETKTLHPPKESFFSHTLWKIINLVHPSRGLTAQDTQGQPEPCPGRRSFFRERRAARLPAVPPCPTEHRQAKKTWIQESHGHRGWPGSGRRSRPRAGGGVQSGAGPSPMQVRREGGGLCCALGSIRGPSDPDRRVSDARGPRRR